MTNPAFLTARKHSLDYQLIQDDLYSSLMSDEAQTMKMSRKVQRTILTFYGFPPIATEPLHIFPINCLRAYGFAVCAPPLR